MTQSTSTSNGKSLPHPQGEHDRQAHLDLDSDFCPFCCFILIAFDSNNEGHVFGGWEILSIVFKATLFFPHLFLSVPGNASGKSVQKAAASHTHL